jgi:hypothetical protein
VATIVATTAAAVAKISATKFEGGGGDIAGAAAPAGAASSLGRGYGYGGIINGPSHQSAAGGTMINAEGGEAIMNRNSTAMFKPALSAMNKIGGGVAFAGSVSSAYDNPIRKNPSIEGQTAIISKTYVVSSEMTSEQEKQARLKNLSVI